MKWISVKDELPKEYDSIFSKFYQKGRQLRGMFAKVSDEVIVSGRYQDGKKFVTTSKTHDGAWDISRAVPMTITHWQPLPQPPKED